MIEPAHALAFLFEEDEAWAFAIVTLALGGGAAFLAGRAAARAWGSRLVLVAQALLIAAAARFLHYALFAGTLISPYYYGIDAAVIVVSALAGFGLTRTRQMRTQYGFLRGAP